MCRLDTGRQVRRLLIVNVMAGALALGQTSTEPLRPEWRKVGSSSIDLMLAAPATGPVGEVWFSQDGRTLYARTQSGKILQTVDFENWALAATPAARPEPVAGIAVERLPAANAVLRASPADARRIYALATQVYVSADGGRNWSNLTGYHDESVIGSGQHDLAVSPLDPNELVVANERGVWRSLDGGLSWSGLNRFLPNF